MNGKTKKMVMGALLASLICVATMLIKIPSPLKGYMNLGDCVVLIAGWMLSPVYAFLAAGLGSAMADIFSGYVIYAPATFVIKGIMALLAHYSFKLLRKRLKNFGAKLLGGVVAEITMILGYYIFEGILYGWVPSLVNIPANIIQGVLGLCVGIVLVRVFEKNKIAFE